MKRRENYFEQHYYQFLRDDIKQFADYNAFFKKEFDAMEKEIAERMASNGKLRIVIAGLKDKLMGIMKENRQTHKKHSLQVSLGNTIEVQSPTRNTEATDSSVRVITEPDRLKKSLSSCK